MNTGNLYLLVGGRPQLRVFARIPCRHTAWFLNNDKAGRGASQQLVNRSFKTTVPVPKKKNQAQQPLLPFDIAVGKLGRLMRRRPGPMAVPPPEPSDDGPLAIRRAQARHTPFASTSTSIPAADRADTVQINTQALSRRIDGDVQSNGQPQIAQHSDPAGASQDTSQPGRVRHQGSSQEAHNSNLVEASEDQNQTSQSEEPNHIGTSRENLQSKAVQHDSQTERIRSRVALWDQEERAASTKAVPFAVEQRFTPSDQIYVMGTDPVGRYIAYALAGCESLPPPYYMLHAYGLGRNWNRAGRCITVYEGKQAISRDRIIGLDTSTSYYDEDTKNMVIKNFIVTVPAGHVLRVLEPFVHRLDHRSTICLVNDGLGVAEDLIQVYFPDVLRRPTFLLGHFSTLLGHTGDQFSVDKVREGRLYLTLFQQTIADPIIRQRFKRHPPIERTQNAQHLLRILTAVPDLNASGHPPQDFFRYKLPTVAFQSVIDPLTVMLDCTYDKLPSNSYARLLIDQLLAEVCGVVSRMWECRNSQKFQQFAASSKLRDEVWHKMMRRRTASSRMRTDTARGRETDIDYLCGYFVRRGREQGLSVKTLDTIISEVKGKQQVARERQGIDIPLEI